MPAASSQICPPFGGPEAVVSFTVAKFVFMVTSSKLSGTTMETAVEKLLEFRRGNEMFKKLRDWWTKPVILPTPAMLEDRLAPQELRREEYNKYPPLSASFESNAPKEGESK